ncbi:MAG TPA: ATP-binding protein [Verrucomicrobiae bacterium]|nr:ATP-binding protein [Verrucomicrobiae bacterium]
MKSDVVFGLLDASWPVLLVGETGVIQMANKKAVETLGPTVETGSTPLESLWRIENNIAPAEFFVRCEASPSTPASIRLKGAGGVDFWFQAWVSIFVDDGKKSFILQLHPPENKPNGVEAGLAHKQKLDCALQLARTVSLDFNNALTSILGHTSLILSKLEPDNPWRRSLMEVEKSAAKAAEIANDLGAFSRQEKEAKVQMSGNLNTLLQRNVEMFQSAKLDKEVAWSLQLERKLFMAKFDEAKMQQALLKIMENAIESLGSANGRIILQTKNIELTEPTQDRNAQLAAGSYVCAEIADNGCGIEPDVLPRIFEPFFTTKRGSKHRGLGLAWVYGIVTNLGGVVAVSSQSNTGTSVRVYLPADKKIVRDHSTATISLNGSETILMVDDEDLLLTMGQTILSTYGYHVLTANNGQKALEILSKNERPIDLLLTELVMPGMSGRELVEKVRQVSPFTRILCSSGYVRPTSQEVEQTAYLQKPFTSQELLMKVKQALSAGEPAPVDS